MSAESILFEVKKNEKYARQKDVGFSFLFYLGQDLDFDDLLPLVRVLVKVVIRGPIVLLLWRPVAVWGQGRGTHQPAKIKKNAL